MDTKTIEQVNVFKADALSIVCCVEGGKNDLACISGRAEMTEIGFFYAGSAIICGATAMRIC